MVNEYKIQLGVDLKPDGLKDDIKKLDGKYKVKLGVDLAVNDIRDRIKQYNTNSNNIKVKLKATVDTDDIKRQIKALDLSTGIGKGVSVPVNTQSLEDALKEVKGIISSIQSSIGNVGDGSDFKPLISSINQIGNALEKTSGKFEELTADLRALTSKDFNVNIGLKLGGNSVNNNAAYSDFVKDEVLPSLEKQERELRNYIAKHFNTNEIMGLNKLAGGELGGVAGIIETLDKLNTPLKKSESLKDRMRDYKNFINTIISSANIQGIDLSPVLSQFDKLPNELIETADNIRDSVKQTDDAFDKLKQVFGGGNNFNVEGISGQLDSVVSDLNEIRTALQSLSSGNPLGGLTQSFDRLSSSIENLLTNAEKVKGILGSATSSVGVNSISDTKVKAENIMPNSNEVVQSAQQVGKKIGETVENAVEQSIDIDDVIDKQVLGLMDTFAVVGDKGSNAFKEIRQALVECRSELNVLNNSDVGIDEEVFDTSAAIDKVTKAIAKQMNAVNDLGDEYIKLANYITDFNRKNAKVHIPDFIKQEQGDDYKSNRSGLGIAFTTGKGQDFADFITELNGNIGQTIDLTKGEAEAFDELVRKVNLGRQQISASKQSEKTLYANASTEDILAQNGISREEIYGEAMSIVKVIDSVEDQIAQASTEATRVISANEEKKQQAYKATTDTVMYHAGIVSKLNKAETNGRFYGSNRGTGYFGTGHYFVDSATKHELDNSSYSKLPYTSIDISQYDNLFPANTDDIASKLHTFLNNLTRFTQGSEIDVSDLFEQFRSVFGDTIMDVKEFGSKLDQLKTFMSNSSISDRSDSVSTQFMKSLGYGGVDTRGTRFADTTYGTVIYDLKEESILQANITDELQKQGQMLEKINYEKGQVFDKDTDARIQKQLDEEAKRQEVIDEFEKSFDSTNLDLVNESLENARNKIDELENNISEFKHSLNNLDEEYEDYVREMSDLGFDKDDLLLLEDEDEWKNNRADIYRDLIDEASQERDRLQSEIPALEEMRNREGQLANEAYEKAKQVVEQRHLEAQQAQESANAVVQAEERKQQEAKETADVYGNTARQVQQSNKLISDSAQNAVDSVTSKSIDRAFRVSEDDSIKFKNEMENLVSQWTNGKGELTDIKIDTASIYDKDTDRYIEEITRAQVSYNNELGETIKKTIAWRQIGTEIKIVDGKETPSHLMGFAEVSSQYSKSLGKTKVQTDKFVKEQQREVSNLTNQINQLNRAATDQNANRPIKKTDSLDALESKYQEIIVAIKRMGEASSSTFDEERNNVRTLISEYKSLRDELRNADNVSTKMKGTDFASGLDIAKNDLEKFKAQAKDFPQITQTIKALDEAIENVGDASSLNKFNDQLRVARSELAKVKAETIATNRKEKVGIKRTAHG